MNVTIQPGLLQGAVTAPPSKSHAHRLLIVAALAEGERRYEIKICQKPPVYGALRLAGMPIRQEKG